MTEAREVSGKVVGITVTGLAVVLAVAGFVLYKGSRDPARSREPTTWQPRVAADGGNGDGAP